MRICLLPVFPAAFALGLAAAHSQPVTIGVLSDMSGVYADFNGQGLVTAVQMAVQERGGAVLGRPIQVLVTDPEEKPTNALSAVRQWIDQDNAAVVIEGTTSTIALAVQKLTEDKKTMFFALSGTIALTNEACSPYGVQYVWNNYAMAHGVGKAETKPGDKWFFLTADYTFGKTLEAETASVVISAGGKVVGTARHPLAISDFSSFLLQAQGAGATTLALANAGRDTQNAIQQPNEFGLGRTGIRVQPLVLFDTDVRGIGLESAQGLQYVTGFYWDQNDRARAWSKAFLERTKTMPTMNQAGAYSATLQYLKAVEKAGSLDVDKVRAALRQMPIGDAFTQDGTIRDNGSLTHSMYLMQVKRPGESKDKWDIATVVRALAPDEVFQPLKDSTCPMQKH